MALKTLSTKIKKLTALVLSTLAVLTFSSSSFASQITSEVELIRQWTTTTELDGSCGHRGPFVTVTYSSNCLINKIAPRGLSHENIMISPGQYAEWSVSVKTDDAMLFRSFSFQSPYITDLDVIYSPQPDYYQTPSDFKNWATMQAKMTFYNSSSNDVELILSPQSGEYVFGGFNLARVQNFYITTNYVNQYKKLTNSTANTENNAQQQLEGQDNIKNQDTSGKDQGTGGQEQSLLDVFNGFITAITGAQATNCNLAMDLGVVDIGTVNLCSLNPPTWVSVVGSIVIIVIFVPLSMAILNRILRLIREMQT